MIIYQNYGPSRHVYISMLAEKASALVADGESFFLVLKCFLFEWNCIARTHFKKMAGILRLLLVVTSFGYSLDSAQGTFSNQQKNDWNMGCRTPAVHVKWHHHHPQWSENVLQLMLGSSLLCKHIFLPHRGRSLFRRLFHLTLTSFVKVRNWI